MVVPRLMDLGCAGLLTRPRRSPSSRHANGLFMIRFSSLTSAAGDAISSGMLCLHNALARLRSESTSRATTCAVGLAQRCRRDAALADAALT